MSFVNPLHNHGNDENEYIWKENYKWIMEETDSSKSKKQSLNNIRGISRIKKQWKEQDDQDIPQIDIASQAIIPEGIVLSLRIGNGRPKNTQKIISICSVEGEVV